MEIVFVCTASTKPCVSQGKYKSYLSVQLQSRSEHLLDSVQEDWRAVDGLQQGCGSTSPIVTAPWPLLQVTYTAQTHSLTSKPGHLVTANS